MSARIPENIVERIINESDVVSVISEFIALKKSGKDYKGLCPFHQEKTPSFYVVPSKGFFHCFGCGKGGSVANFIMEHERMDYPSALRYLAEKAGIEIPRAESVDSFEEKLYSALNAAASYYQNTLYDHPAGKMVLEYLESRGISKDTARLFGFGFAPSGWENLIKNAAARGIKVADLEAAGLVSKKEKYYDRFRNRLMIPIKTLSGKVLGVGGRAMPGDDSPKYINSPETAVYKKGQILYGMDLSRDFIRDKDEAVVVEGYFDLVALHQAGIRNVVAVSGTGFTVQQASLLSRFCRRVILLYDSDSAGIRAANRACGVLYDSGLQPSLVLLPRGFDPDSFVREKGSSELSGLIDNSVDIIEFVGKGLQGPFSIQSLSVQKRTITFLSEMMSPIEDNLTRDLLAKKMFDRLDIDIRTLGTIGESQAQPSEKSLPGRLLDLDINEEKKFLGILMENPLLFRKCEGLVNESIFSNSRNGRIFAALRNLFDSNGSFNMSEIERVLTDTDDLKLIREIMLTPKSESDSAAKFDDYLFGFRFVLAGKRLNELRNAILHSESNREREKSNELTRAFHVLEEIRPYLKFRRLDKVEEILEEARRKADHDKLEILTREFQNLKLEVKANDAKV